MQHPCGCVGLDDGADEGAGVGLQVSPSSVGPTVGNGVGPGVGARLGLGVGLQVWPVLVGDSVMPCTVCGAHQLPDIMSMLIILIVSS